MGNNQNESANTSSPATPRKASGRVLKFFKSVPGILTAAVGVVTCIAAIISQFAKIAEVVQPPKSISQLIEVPPPQHLKILPYRLRNLVGNPNVPYLYWYYLEVKNKSHLRVNVTVSFEVKTRKGEVIPCKISPDYSVDPHEILKVYPPTILDFGQLPVRLGDTLVIIWLIRDEKDTVIKQGTDETELLPDNTVDWDLRQPNGEPVPASFLLASLTAWTMPPTESLAKTVEQLQHGIGRAADPSSVARWFARSYGQFFNNPSGVQVSSAHVTFPGTGRQTIRTFSEILNEREADSLEAALFLGALSRATYGKRLRLVLFAVSESQDQPSAKTILFSWSTDSHSWHAVNLAHANSSGFKDNEKLASIQVAKLLAHHPEIIPALDDPGVFLEKGHQAVAMDLVHADQKFQFSSLLKGGG